MNLLFHELIEAERRKDRLSEAAHWQLVKQFKQEQTRYFKPRIGLFLNQILESGRDWLVERVLPQVFTEQ